MEQFSNLFHKSLPKGDCSTWPLGGPCYIHLTNETKCHFPLKTRGFQDFCYGNLYLIISFFKLLITIIFHVGDIKAPPIRVTLSCQFYFFLTWFELIVFSIWVTPWSLLRRGVLYPFNYGKLFSFIQYIRNKEDIDWCLLHYTLIILYCQSHFRN